MHHHTKKITGHHNHNQMRWHATDVNDGASGDVVIQLRTCYVSFTVYMSLFYDLPAKQGMRYNIEYSIKV